MFAGLKVEVRDEKPGRGSGKSSRVHETMIRVSPSAEREPPDGYEHGDASVDPQHGIVLPDESKR
jgi:hypothetical protein